MLAHQTTSPASKTKKPPTLSPVTQSQLSLSDQRDSMSLTLDELDSHLYGCADKIRNAVDKTDYLATYHFA